MAGVEVWRKIPGWENAYEVSSTGAVRSLARTVPGPGGHPRRIEGVELSPSTSPTGYKRVNLYGGGKQTTRGVHQLVMMAFVGSPPKGMEVCHNDGDKSNNRLENLRYDSKRANQLDRIAHGNNDKSNRTHCPRGHELTPPNLVAHELKKGHRACLSCARANNHKHKKGLTQEEFTDLSDKFYEALQVAHV